MVLKQSKSVPIPERNLIGMISEISLMSTRIFNRRVKDVGLTRSQWQVLYLLYQQDGQNQTELAETLTMAKPPLGKVVDHLQKDGWVERRDDPTDRRAKRVFLTQKVAPLIGPLENIANEIADITLNGFSDIDRAAFIRSLNIVHRYLAEEAQVNRD